MNPDRKRTIRLVTALGAAVLLASALLYTSFSASSPAVTPSQLLGSSASGRSYQLTGKVVNGSVSHRGGELDYRVRDRSGVESVPVRYTGAVPDPFRDGREVIVTVRRQGAAFVGQRDSLVTKCPSKFAAAPNGQYR
jgi:cytochrome c-type biogenesis protein CcmE